MGLLALLVLAQPAFEDTADPNWLGRLDLSVTFLDRSGQEVGHRGIRHDDRVEMGELPRHLVEAVLATEDRRFLTHWGVDPIGLVRALLANAKADGIVQGGSTITQQLAKNVFLTGERSLDRKIREAFLAVWLEQHLTKTEILKLYLDRAYMGGGTFGVEAAAQLYFGRSARAVSLQEAALLAGLFKAPSRYNPLADPVAAAARASDVLDRMLDSGAITQAERAAAQANPAAIVARGPVASHPGFYLDAAYREVQRLAASGRLGEEAMLTVETSLDAPLQRMAEATVASTLARHGQRFRVGEAAMVVMEPDGAVRAMVGGRDYGASQFNRAVDARRQPGSSFKPFVYAAALTHTGLRPDSAVQDAEICIGRWCPSNYGRTFSGTMSLTNALARSINTVAVRLSVEIGRTAGEMTIAHQARYGRARIIETARALGLSTPLHDTPSLPLGASEVTLLDMTTAYAGFANGGVAAAPHLVREVRSGRGVLLYRRDDRDPSRRRVLSAGVAGEMTRMLAKVVEVGTARAAAIPGHPVAGKTGTTSAYRDAWFVGYSGQLVAGVWFGNDDDTPTRELTGGTLPASTWATVMTFAHRGLPAVALFKSDEPPSWAIRSAPGVGFVPVAAAASGGGFQVIGGR